MSKITVYTAEPCSFCINAKHLLQGRGLPFEEISLTKDPDGRAELARRTGLLTFPQIVVDDEVIGGFTELLAADRDGRLEALAEG